MKFKKLLALILSLIMAVCVFSACDKKEKTDDAQKLKDSQEKEKAAVTELVNDFNELWLAADTDCLKYVVEDKEPRETVESYIDAAKSDLEWMKGEFDWAAELISEDRRPELDALYQEFEKEYMESYRSIEVEDITVSGNTASANVTISQMETKEPIDVEVVCERAIEATGFNAQELENADPETGATSVIEFMDTYSDMILQIIRARVKPIDIVYQLEKTDGKWLIKRLGERLTANNISRYQ